MVPEYLRVVLLFLQLLFQLPEPPLQLPLLLQDGCPKEGKVLVASLDRPARGACAAHGTSAQDTHLLRLPVATSSAISSLSCWACLRARSEAASSCVDQSRAEGRGG